MFTLESLVLAEEAESRRYEFETDEEWRANVPGASLVGDAERAERQDILFLLQLEYNKLGEVQ